MKQASSQIKRLSDELGVQQTTCQQLQSALDAKNAEIDRAHARLLTVNLCGVTRRVCAGLTMLKQSLEAMSLGFAAPPAPKPAEPEHKTIDVRSALLCSAVLTDHRAGFVQLLLAWRCISASCVSCASSK